VNAQLVTSIAANATAPAPPAACVQAIKRLRWERERASIKREIDRLQELDAKEYGAEIDRLSRRLLAVATQLDRDVTGTRD
jgi:hypothetical protein